MKKIVICADIFPPYQYRLEDGTYGGSDYDLVMNTLKRCGYEVDFRIGLWDTVIQMFESGEADGLFQVQDTPERLAKYYLSDKLRDAVTEVITLDESLLETKTYDELAEVRLGVIEGFANGEEIDSLPETCKHPYGDTGSLLKGLDNGEIDVAVCDRGVRDYISCGDRRYQSIDSLTYKRPLYVMFHDKEVRDAFNAAFA